MKSPPIASSNGNLIQGGNHKRESTGGAGDKKNFTICTS